MYTRHLGAALGVLAFAACTDAPSAPMADDLVAQATQMEQFALQAAANGDVQVSADINLIANALRKGVRPTRYEAFTGERWEVFNAIVRVEEHLGDIHPNVVDRNFVLWHFTPEIENFHVMRVNTTASHGVMDLGLGDPGFARYHEVAATADGWAAFEGIGRILDEEVGQVCAGEDTPEARNNRMRCFKAQYRVVFELRFTPEGGGEPLLMWSRPQLVNAIKWVERDIPN